MDYVYLVGVCGVLDDRRGRSGTKVRARFDATNPTLQTNQIGIDESKASEITAFLRPNPQLGVTVDPET